MNNISNNLEKIGFGEWLLETVAPESLEQFDIARVVAAQKVRHTISNGEVDVLAELVGKIIFSASSPVDYPAVGDWALVNFYDENTFAIIHEVISRKSLLKRKTPGKKVDFQLIIDGNKTCDFLAKSQPILIHNHPIVFNNRFLSFSEFLYCIGMRPTSLFYNNFFQYKNLCFQIFPSLLTNSILTHG